MTSYSYSIFIDQQQLDELDDKIRKLESLSDSLDVGDEGFAAKINEILELSGIRSEDKSKLDINEINSGITFIKNHIRYILNRMDDLEIDEDKIASIMANLAKQEGAGDIMGTKPLLDAIERLEKISTGETTVGTGPTQVPPDQFLADLKANVLSGQDLSMFAERGDIDMEALGAPKVLNDRDFFINFLERGMAMSDLAPKRNEYVEKLIEDIDKYIVLNKAVLDGMKDPAGSGATAPPHFYEKGMPGEEPTLLPEDMPREEWITFLNDEISRGTDELIEANKDLSLVADASTAAIGERGWGTKFAAELSRISEFIVETQSTITAFDSELAPEEVKERVQKINDVLKTLFVIPEGGVGYSIDDLEALGKTAKSFGWKTELDIIRDILLAYEGVSTGMEGGAHSLLRLQKLLDTGEEERSAESIVKGTNLLAGFPTNLTESAVRLLQSDDLSIEKLEELRAEALEQTGSSTPMGDLANLTSSQKDLKGEIQDAVGIMTSDRGDPEADRFNDLNEKLKNMTRINDDMNSTTNQLVDMLEQVVTGVTHVIEKLGQRPKGPGVHGI